MRFTYSSGERPLEGYTIKRGIGRGGFGEVYYALSDGGKEVALKLVRSNLDIELRGMSQCLNLKHPNLVNLYDLRSDAQGNHWVIMEYVAGEPLSALLSRHPDGLAPELAREWFLGLAAAVSYLHEHGIVHRDLKPGNIFIENGQVKVGDYGLSKFIGGSQRSPQTQSVGTVHYMAPEISTGNYNRQIDIYAAGILLYEMLTGRVPFDGESAGEILMKHLTSPPDLSKVPSPFVPVLDRALSKNAALRYQTIAEMAKEVAAIGAAPASGKAGETRDVLMRETLPLPPPTESAADRVEIRSQMAELCGSLVLAAVLAAVFAIFWAAVSQTTEVTRVAGCFYVTVACTWAVLIPAKVWNAPVEDSWKRRVVLLALGLAIGLLASWQQGYSLSGLDAAEVYAEGAAGGGASGGVMERLFPDERTLPRLAAYLAYFALLFFALRWWQLAERRRAHRFSLFALLPVAFWAYVLPFLMPGKIRALDAVAVVAAAAIVQVVSPWERPVAARTKRLRLRYV